MQIDDQPIQEDETVPIDDINVFAAAVGHWHENRVNQIKHFMTIPEGTTVDFNGKDIELKGDAYIAFQAALITALDIFGVLPFMSTEVDVDDAENTVEQTNE